MAAEIFRDLSRRLEKYIADNHITGRLPGVHKLSRELGVHHVTIRKALELLKEKGLVAIQPTQGTFILDTKPEIRNHHLIGIIGFYLGDSFNDLIYSCVNEQLKKTGYQITGITNNIRLFKERPRLLLQFPVDGLVFIGSSISRNISNTLQEQKLPVICALNQSFSEINQVGMDHHQGHSDLLDMIRSHGHRRVAFVNYRREEEFKSYLDDIRSIFQEKLGADFHEELFHVVDSRTYYLKYFEQYNAVVAEEFCRKWRDQPPDAIVTTMRLGREFLRMNCPSELYVVGMDQEDSNGLRFSAKADPLTLLYKASSRMVEIIEGDTQIKQIRIPFRIYQKDSNV